MTKFRGWLGVDLDGTLAEYHGWIDYTHIGAPIESMVNKIKQILEEDQLDVKIFTARLCDSEHREQIIEIIQAYCEEHLGKRLEVTNVKDFGMVELWDDRCRRVIVNSGNFCCDL